MTSTPTTGDGLGEGRYVVTRLIGEGAQGQTLEAIDKRDGTLVAIKRFSVRGASSWKDVELAEREARVLAQLNHPSLPRHLDHFEERGALYLVMSLVGGEALSELRRRGELLDQSQVIDLLQQLSDVLIYLSRRAPPVIHRDIKPGNILRRADGSYALVDFGSVRDQLKQDGSTVVGTFGYMAPEQFQGRALPVSDVYGLGATALTLLTGVEPDKQPHEGLGIDVAAALGASADRRLVHLLQGMLTPDPDRRTRDLGPALAALRAESARDYWHAGRRATQARSGASSGAEPRPGRARPFTPPLILVIFGAGFWFSSSTRFSLMVPLMSLMIAAVVWFYMSGGLKLERFQEQLGGTGRHRSKGERTRVGSDEHERHRVGEADAGDRERESASNSSGKNRRSV
ncbi:MAG: serine/threonine-protein kinase [Polyangiaceae bacterium]